MSDTDEMTLAIPGYRHIDLDDLAVVDQMLDILTATHGVLDDYADDEEADRYARETDVLARDIAKLVDDYLEREAKR